MATKTGDSTSRLILPCGHERVVVVVTPSGACLGRCLRCRREWVDEAWREARERWPARGVEVVRAAPRYV